MASKKYTETTSFGKVALSHMTHQTVKILESESQKSQNSKSFDKNAYSYHSSMGMLKNGGLRSFKSQCESATYPITVLDDSVRLHIIQASYSKHSFYNFHISASILLFFVSCHQFFLTSHQMSWAAKSPGAPTLPSVIAPGLSLSPPLLLSLLSIIFAHSAPSVKLHS